MQVEIKQTKGNENYSGKRVSRGKHMNIIRLDTMNGKKIPIYSKGMLERDKMIREYYKYCNINERTIDELSLVI